MTGKIPDTVAGIDAEVAKIEAQRASLAARMTALRRARRAAVVTEAEARTRALGAALLALDGPEDLVAAEAARLIAVARSEAQAAEDGSDPVADSTARVDQEASAAVA